MNALEVSQRSTDAWNRHDADALVALYAEGGTYHNPRLDHALTGQAIGDFAKSVWAAYPDMSLEIISRGDTGGRSRNTERRFAPGRFESLSSTKIAGSRQSTSRD
jgi:SnoaL-like domain